MPRISVPVHYVNTYRARGKLYSYYRRDGKRIRLKAAPGTIEFLKEIEVIEQGWVTVETPEKGTLGHLIARYKGSDWFADLKPATQVSYNRAFDALRPLHSGVTGTLLGKVLFGPITD